jgi:hypothetical protein
MPYVRIGISWAKPVRTKIWGDKPDGDHFVILGALSNNKIAQQSLDFRVPRSVSVHHQNGNFFRRF